MYRFVCNCSLQPGFIFLQLGLGTFVVFFAMLGTSRRSSSISAFINVSSVEGLTGCEAWHGFFLRYVDGHTTCYLHMPNVSVWYSGKICNGNLKGSNLSIQFFLSHLQCVGRTFEGCSPVNHVQHRSLFLETQLENHLQLFLGGRQDVL